MGKRLEPIKKICVHCGNEFDAYRTSTICCSHDCISAYLKEHKYDNGVENIDYVICKMCGRRVARVYGKHLNEYHNGMTSTEYKGIYPDAPMYCQSDKANTSINSGKHMKEDKYRKMASDAMLGEKNPNHKSNTTDDQRKKISPFSKEFYKAKYNIDDDKAELMVRSFAKDAIADRIGVTSLDYYLKKYDGDEDKANAAYLDRQRTFTKDKLIVKYGEVEGLRRWTERQQKWKDCVYNKTTCISRGRSDISESLFDKLCIIYANEKILYGKHEKFIHDGKRPFKYDFTINNKIIEFNGTFWHCKPDNYKSDYFHKVKKMTAQQIWDYDAYKIKLANEHNYSVLTVWEDDYRKDPQSVLKKCIDFIDS